jgi:hypothetical protein
MLLAAGACALVAGLSLIPLHQETANDPNSWLAWATQLAAGHSVNFAVGPSWKPLPLMVTTPIALISPSAAAIFWLGLVRFSALMASVVLFDLTRREGGPFAGAVAALLPFAIAPWTKTAITGMAEPVATAAMLGSLCAAVRGHRRFCFLLMFAAGLARPEAWVLLGAYCVWWAREDRQAIVWLLAGAALTLIAWLGLPVAAGGKALQSADRAIASGTKGPGSLLSSWSRNLPARSWTLIPVGAWASIQRRWTIGLIITSASIVWLVEITALTLMSYPAIGRYEIPAAVALCSTAGLGAAWLRSLVPIGAARNVITLAVAAVVGWSVAAGVGDLRTAWNNAIVFQDSSDQAISAIDRAGGISALSGCLPLLTSGDPTHSRIEARRLGLPLADVGRSVPGARIALISSDPAVGLPPELPRGPQRTLAESGGWRLVQLGPPGRCSAGR